MLETKIKEKYDILRQDYTDLVKHIMLDSWKKEISSFEERMSKPDFWNNQREAKSINKKLKVVRDRVSLFESIRDDYSSMSELAEIADEQSQSEMEKMIESLSVNISKLQIELLFTDELDSSNAIMTIHPGSGGTESCDWAEMLLRMYLKYFQKMNYKYTIIDNEPADIAGIKSVSIDIQGEYAYGYLKSEIGVHRLVRVSPFDSNARRHTSFAAVYILPDIEENIDFELDENELRVDAFRAGGPGGQNVNKVSTAIRITHIPTGLFAKSQNERSQIQNKTNAMKVLKAKVYEHYRQIEEEKLNSKLEKKSAIEFGNQIRSYVMYPYKMVKDLRTKHETSDVESVMNGNLDQFIKEYLIQRAKERGEANGKQ